MLGSSCSPCCGSCTLPEEIPARLSWSYASASNYRWFPTSSYFGGYATCANTAAAWYSTPSELFSQNPSRTGDFTLTQYSASASGTLRVYAYFSSYRLADCCNQNDWNAWVARVPGWAFDVPPWKRLGFSVTAVHYGTVTFYAKEYGSLEPYFANAVSIIRDRGDNLPGTPCGLARCSAFLDVHVKYENGECALYDADFQTKGTGNSFGVPYPEQSSPWPQAGGFSNGVQEQIRFVAYGVQGGKVWLSSAIELQAAGSSQSQPPAIAKGSHIYVPGANTLSLI